MFTVMVIVASLSRALAEEPVAVTAVPVEAAAPMPAEGVVLTQGVATASDGGAATASGVAATRYEQLALHRTDRTAWKVIDGHGHEIDLQTWAALTGDRAGYERAAKARARRTEWGWRAMSVGAFAVSALGVAAVRPLNEDVGGEEWVAALTRQDAFVAGAAVAGAAGFGMLVVSFAEPPPPKHLAARVRTWVPASQADAVIAGFNAQLREDLRVPE